MRDGRRWGVWVGLGLAMAFLVLHRARADRSHTGSGARFHASAL